MNEIFSLKKVDILKRLICVCAEIQGQDAVSPHVLGRDGNMPSVRKAEIEMMLLTIAAESSFVHRMQFSGGPARGLCGMEPATVLDTFRWLEGKTEYWKRLTSIWMGLKSIPFFTPTEEEVGEHLQKHDPFALALARLHYKMFPAKFPEDLWNQATYWKKIWNTAAGAGTVDYAMIEWEDCKCERMMKQALIFCDLVE